MNQLLIAQILVSIFLTVSILLQSQRSGLGSAWGGSGEHFRTKRGAERIVFYTTIILTILFLTLAVLNALTS